MIRFSIEPPRSFFEAKKRYDKYLYKRYEIGMRRAVRFLFNETKKIVPVETGKLKKTGKMKIVGTGRNAEGRIWYATKYGAIVHEDLTKTHGAAYNVKYARQIRLRLLKKKKPDEQAKYIERPMQSKANQKEMIRLIKISFGGYYL